MDRDTAVARIQEKLGFRTDLVSPIVNALQESQDELERGASLPWFLLYQFVPLVVNPSVPPSAAPVEVPIPTNIFGQGYEFIRDADERDGGLRWQQTNPGPCVFLEKMDLKEAENFFFARRLVWWDNDTEIIQSEDTSFTPGVPMVYVLRNNTFRIYPGPDVQYNLFLSAYLHDLRLDGSNITNAWLTNAPWLLIGKAGMLMAMSTRDADALAAFSAIVYGDPSKGIRGAEKDYLASIYEREVGGRSYSLGARL